MLLPRAHLCLLQIHPGLCFPEPQPGMLHDLGGPNQTQTHTGRGKKTTQNIPDLSSMPSKSWGRRKLLPCLILSPSCMGEGDKRKWLFPHCGRSLSVCFFPIIRVVGPGHSYVFNPTTGCQKDTEALESPLGFPILKLEREERRRAQLPPLYRGSATHSAPVACLSCCPGYEGEHHLPP